MATKTKKAAPVNDSPLSPNQVRILEMLVSGKEVTRKQMAEKLEIEKGFSKLLGAPSSEDSATNHPNALQTRGYVTCRKPDEEEGGSALLYSITAAGRKGLEAAKAEAKAEKKAPKKAKEEKASNGKAVATKKAPAKKAVTKKAPKKIKVVEDDDAGDEDAGDEE